MLDTEMMGGFGDNLGWNSKCRNRSTLEKAVYT